MHDFRPQFLFAAAAEPRIAGFLLAFVNPHSQVAVGDHAFTTATNGRLGGALTAA